MQLVVSTIDIMSAENKKIASNQLLSFDRVSTLSLFVQQWQFKQLSFVDVHCSLCDVII